MCKKLVSIIIPTYNGADKIKRAVDSVLLQTYKNIEIIIVDDNGIMSHQQIQTERILTDYISSGKVIYIPHEVNRNGSAARNTGIKKAKGEYICFLDDDDEFLANKTEFQVNTFDLLDPSYGMVFGKVRERLKGNRIRERKINFNEETFLFDFLCDAVPACSSTVMIRREILNTVVGWDESFKRHQDWEFFSRIAAEYKVAFLDEVLIQKNRFDSNLPKDGKTTEVYRDHFLNKMNPIINTLSIQEQKTIYNHHYTDVGKVYLKNKDISNAMRLARKTDNCFKTIMIYVVDGVKYLMYRRHIHG